MSIFNDDGIIKLVSFLTNFRDEGEQMKSIFKKYSVIVFSLLLIIATIAAAIAFSGCSNNKDNSEKPKDEAKHNYSEEWTSDNLYHWHECLDENCTSVKDKEYHSWDKGTVTAQPTYETSGEIVYTCLKCKKSKVEVLGKKVAKENDGWVVKYYSGDLNVKDGYWITGVPKIDEKTNLDGSLIIPSKIQLKSGKIVDIYGLIGPNASSGERMPLTNINSYKYVDILNGVKEIGYSAFYGKDVKGKKVGNFTWIGLPTSVIKIGDYAFEESTFEYITIPDSVIKIGMGAFKRNTSLKHISLSSSIDKIDQVMFEYCTALSQIEIPKGVRTIGVGAFRGCDSLSNVTIPNKVIGIHQGAFARCKNLIEISIPASVKEIVGAAFGDCENLLTIKVEEENANYKSVDGNLYSKDGKKIIQYAIGKKETIFTVPNGVEVVGSAAFFSAKLLEIVLPEGLLTLENSAFSYSSLETIVLPSSLTTIKAWAFEHTNLTSIVIPKNVTTLEGRVFFNCQKLKYIKMSGQSLSSEFVLPKNGTDSVWVWSAKSSNPLNWTNNVVEKIPAESTSYYYHQKCAYEN